MGDPEGGGGKCEVSVRIRGWRRRLADVSYRLVDGMVWNEWPMGMCG